MYGADCRNGDDDKPCMHDLRFILSRFYTLASGQPYIPPTMLNFYSSVVGQVKYTHYEQGSPCPPTHFECPDVAYRLPVYVRCNGVFDCPYQQDEEGCDTYQCPGFYRCRGAKVCLHPLHLCDGRNQCPQYDDEWFCNMTCPQTCSCVGLSFTCPYPFLVEKYPHVRYLDAEGNGMSPAHLWNNSMLVYVRLAACRLKQLALPWLPNVKILDVSNNDIDSVTLSTLENVSNLNQLLIAKNPLTSLFTSNTMTSLLTFPDLQHIDLSAVVMEHLDTIWLKPFPGLTTLNLSDTSIQRISGEALANVKLSVLDMTGCGLEEFPTTLLKNLSQLTDLRGDNPKLCCEHTLPAGFDTKRCQAPRSVVSSCDNLLGSYTQRVVVSVMAAATLLGNLAVLLGMWRWRRTKDSVTIFVFQLCMSKCMMGVYLSTLSVADSVSSGSYLWEDREWRTGAWCQVLALLFLLSSQVSVFLQFSMTMDRYLSIAWGHKAWTARLTVPMCVLSWCGGLVLACMALGWRVFSQTSLCTALPIAGHLRGGHHYTFGLLVILNGALMLLTTTGQVYIHSQVVSNPLAFLTDTPLTRDLTSSRRVVSLAITDSTCWMLVAVWGALTPHRVFVPGDAMYILSMHIIFLSSCLTPYLYIFSGVSERRRQVQKRRLLKRLGDHSVGKLD